MTDDYHDLWPAHAGQPWCGEGECRRCQLERDEDEAAAESQPWTWPGNDMASWNAEEADK